MAKKQSQLTQLIDRMAGTVDDQNSYDYDGSKVPRVTAIISKCIHNDGLMYWANSLGFKHQSYSKTLQLAADIGTYAHNAIDMYLDNSDYEMNSMETPFESRMAYQSFLKWFEEINKVAKVKVLMHEKTLVCKYFGGTLDGLYEINGRVYLIDYKTSNHVTERYTLQLAAYRYMLRELMDIHIDGCIVLQLSKSDVSYNEYVLNLDNDKDFQYMNWCEECFLSLVYAYYNINRIEQEYKKLEWKN